MDFLLLLLALLGHAFFWIGLVNRLHALGIRRWLIDFSTGVLFLSAASIPLGIGWWCTKSPERLAGPWRLAGGGFSETLIAAYFVLCWIAALATFFRIVLFFFLHRTPSLVRLHRRWRAKIDMHSAATDAGEASHHFLVHLPLNEIVRLNVVDWTLDVPRLDPALNGLSVVHLSDFHFNGRIGKAYFREVARVTNELQPDIVALTGDLIDSPACFDWIPDTLGQLAARHGVYFVLGNHDLLTRDVPRLRRTLEQCGLVDLGGRECQIEINGQPVWLAGNELPWIKGQECCETQPSAACDFASSAEPLRIALAHSPDQLAWARAQNADLLLAGHTHGGQICFPPLGAIFSPSAWGVKHISGIYHLPPTILHVTRGVSGDTPIRWNCPPEIARLKLIATRGV